MQKTHMLPTIEDEALDGVTGGAGDVGTLVAKVMDITIKTPMAIAGARFTALGGIFTAFGEFLQGKP
jgi:hypothetical protein